MMLLKLPALTQSDLNAIECSNADCPTHLHDDDAHPLVLTPDCHPHAGVEVSYTKGDGVLHMHCVKCGGWLADVEVAAP